MVKSGPKPFLGRWQASRMPPPEAFVSIGRYACSDAVMHDYSAAAVVVGLSYCFTQSVWRRHRLLHEIEGVCDRGSPIENEIGER